MNKFELDKRLATDCIILGYLNGVIIEPASKMASSVLLLMNNADFPWLVIVPIGVEAIDIDELSEQRQLQILKEANALSAFLKRHYPVDKINFATIGNIVSQMHFHLVARNRHDSAWPGVVWGTKATKKYSNDQIETLKNLLNEEIEFFKLNIAN